MSKILITSHHTYNQGDSAALLSMVEALKNLSPDSEIIVLSDDPEVTAGRDEVKVLRWLIDRKKLIKYSKGQYTRWLSYPLVNYLLRKGHQFWWLLTSFLGEILASLSWALLRRHGINSSLFLSSETREILNEFADADVILRSPGGSFNENFGFLEVLIDPLYIYLAKLLGKPFMLYGVSIGPIRFTPYRIVAKYALNKVDMITLREELSKNQLTKLGVNKPRVYVTADSALLLKPSSSVRINEIMKSEGLIEKRLLIGITLMDWHYPGFSDRELRRIKYMQTMAKAADFFIKEWNAVVLFVPMNYGPFCDKYFIREVIGLMQFEEGSRILSGHYDPRELQGIFSMMDFFVAGRLHALILSSKVNVPGIVIMYEHKAKGFMDMLGLERFVLDINTLQYDGLVNAITEAWSQKDVIKRQFEEKLSAMEKRSFLNAELAMGLLQPSGKDSTDLKKHPG